MSRFVSTPSKGRVANIREDPKALKLESELGDDNVVIKVTFSNPFSL